MRPTLRQLAAGQIDFLLFRDFRHDLKQHYAAWLGWGLAMTWLAGIGRYWDNPQAALWQKAGFGSLVYVVILAFLLWAVASPLRPRGWSYRNVLLFVTMTSAPALLYAIPVEMMMSVSAAQSVNALFLAVVAAWRMALLFALLRRAAGLSWAGVVVSALLPVTLIVTALAVLNLEHAVFEIMAGINREPHTGREGAYSVVLGLTMLSYILSPFLLIVYIAQIAKVRRAAPPFWR